METPGKYVLSMETHGNARVLLLYHFHHYKMAVKLFFAKPPRWIYHSPLKPYKSALTKLHDPNSHSITLPARANEKLPIKADNKWRKAYQPVRVWKPAPADPRPPHPCNTLTGQTELVPFFSELLIRNRSVLIASCRSCRSVCCFLPFLAWFPSVTNVTDAIQHARGVLLPRHTPELRTSFCSALTFPPTSLVDVLLHEKVERIKRSPRLRH